LAAANLGFLSSNVLGYSIIIGLVSALDTLSNQAGKSASPKLASLYAMRTFVVCLLFMPFIFLFMWNAYPFFKLLLHTSSSDDTELQIFRLAADYLKIMSLAMPAVAAYECLRRYLQSCGKMIGPALGFALASPLSIFLNWLLVHGPDKYRLGFLGAPVATVIAYNFVSDNNDLLATAYT
jgi:MATE family multidrug resistance protein